MRKPSVRTLRTVTVLLALTLAGAYFGLFATRTRMPSVRCGQLAELGEVRSSEYQHEYEFSEDWFTPNIPVWEAALAHMKGRPGLRYLEVGVYEGRSLIWMLENVLTDQSATASAVDPFEYPGRDDLEAVLRKNLATAQATERVQVIKGYSQTALRHLPLNSFDIVYIDGSHAAPDVLEDAVLSWRLLGEGGVLIFDDYKWHLGRAVRERPKFALDAFAFLFREQMEPVHCGYQLIMRKRPSAPTPSQEQ